jgi:thymidylate synthase (FAD)
VWYSSPMLSSDNSGISVSLVNSTGDDRLIAAAAKVSTQGELSLSTFRGDGEIEGLLSFLMRNFHGSPFENGQMTFLIKAPIFVMREFQRHRAGWSYNEASGRYREFEPEFWIPVPGRKMKQTGKAGEYRFVELDYDPREKIRAACESAYQEYVNLLDKGVAREVARSVLPLATITTMYATANPRAIMHFLSLRTIRENAKHPSFPQHEIAQVADQMELLFADKFPITHKLFDLEGRVSP